MKGIHPLATGRWPGPRNRPLTRSGDNKPTHLGEPARCVLTGGLLPSITVCGLGRRKLPFPFQRMLYAIELTGNNDRGGFPTALG